MGIEYTVFPRWKEGRNNTHTFDKNPDKTALSDGKNDLTYSGLLAKAESSADPGGEVAGEPG